MAAVAKAVLLGFAFVAALVAVLFGLRRARAPVDRGRRGFLGSIKSAFYAAVGVVLGTSASCAGEDDRSDGDASLDDAGWSCYADPGSEESWSPDDGEEVDGGTTEVDDARQTDDADVTADDADPDIEPDADTADPDADLDSGAEAVDGEDPDALVGLAPADRRRRLKWARRTLERAKAVRRLYFDPQTHPAVREALRADLGTLRRHVRLARRWLGVG